MYIIIFLFNYQFIFMNTIPIILLGDVKVGKTSIIRQLQKKKLLNIIVQQLKKKKNFKI